MDNVDSPERPRSNVWTFFEQEVFKAEIVFFAQIILIYIVIIVSLINLTREHEDSNIWIALLGSALGYVLPNPTLERKP